MGTVTQVLTLAAALGAGAIGGVFFAFSAFVMPALGRLPSPGGVAAMQSINITAVRPALMLALFGTAALSAGLAVYALVNWDGHRSVLLLAGAALYLVGTVGLTAAYHVPRNNALASLDPSSPGSAPLWAVYLRDWTRANSVRCLASLAAAAAYALALRGR